jgi:hypothetical protein
VGVVFVVDVDVVVVVFDVFVVVVAAAVDVDRSECIVVDHVIVVGVLIRAV